MALFNPTPSPVVVDDAGHVLGGGERDSDVGLDLDTGSELIAALLGSGQLIDTDAGAETATPGAGTSTQTSAGKSPARTARILPVDPPAEAPSTSTSTSTSTSSTSTDKNTDGKES